MSYKKFEYQCRLNGLTFSDFCELSHISVESGHALISSNGGIAKAMSYLDEITDNSITVGEVVQVLITNGLSCQVSPTNLAWIDKLGKKNRVKLNIGHEKRQEVLYKVLGSVEG